jgi:hypothetical protein
MVEQKIYFCKYLGYNITGIAARNCNYSNLDGYTCRHSGEDCVAKEGLIAFQQKLEQSQPKCIDSIIDETLRQLEWLHEIGSNLPKSVIHTAQGGIAIKIPNYTAPDDWRPKK